MIEWKKEWMNDGEEERSLRRCVRSQASRCHWEYLLTAQKKKSEAEVANLKSSSAAWHITTDIKSQPKISI